MSELRIPKIDRLDLTNGAWEVWPLKRVWKARSSIRRATSIGNFHKRHHPKHAFRTAEQLENARIELGRHTDQHTERRMKYPKSYQRQDPWSEINSAISVVRSAGAIARRVDNDKNMSSELKEDTHNLLKNVQASARARVSRIPASTLDSSWWRGFRGDK
ncbi:MAG: hypothetical protein AAB573_05235 [Patescibacteria group bacterium]